MPPEPTSPYPPPRARAAWVLFDLAAQPWFTLVTTFVFAPFFAAALARDAVSGQALWGYATGAAGLTIALMSPVLGAIADASGPRKPWIAAFALPLVAGSCLLWFAVPGGEWAVTFALIGFFLGTIGAEFATVFNNAMLPTLAPPERIGRLSGTGWAVGYIGGLLSLVLTLGLIVPVPATGLTMLGLAPILPLDAASRAGERFTGPLTAAWFLVFVLPLFLLTPDVPRRAVRLADAARAGLADLAATLRSLPGRPHVSRFLIANMLATDGLVALFAFAGIYAAGTFGWGTTAIGVFGILLTITGTLGAWIGGKLDDRLGPRPVMLGALVVLIVASTAILMVGRDHLFFVIPVAPAPPGAGLYATASEKVYVVLGLVIGSVAGPLQAAGRSLLVRVAPPEATGQYFGLFALSGKVTSFLGPTLVALATDATRSQAAGLAVLVGFFVVAAGLLRGVRA